jgi:hypothetical protein
MNLANDITHPQLSSAIKVRHFIRQRELIRYHPNYYHQLSIIQSSSWWTEHFGQLDEPKKIALQFEGQWNPI